MKDDVLTVRRYGRDQIEPFLEYLNNLHDNIDFTIEIEGEVDDKPGLPFLDMRCITADGRIKTHVYRKPSNTNRYLQYSSNGPPSQKVGVLKSFLYRAHNL